MIAVLRLALKGALARRGTLALTLLSIALATALLLAVERIRHDARQSFTQSVSGVDLVVGPRGGAVQLMLHAVFRSGEAATGMRWDSYRQLAAHPAVDWALPLALGDSYRGFAVLGTTPDYFARFRYGDRQPLRLAAGRPFAGLFEAVLGSEVAARLGHRVSDRIALAHGSGPIEGPGHDDRPFAVVGILAPTGTPVDRSVHVSLESIAALHVDWVGGAPVPGLSLPAEALAKFDLAPKEINAALIGLKRRADAFRMQRFVNELRDEPLMAVLPGVALDELWRTLGLVERTLFAVSALVVAVGLAGLAATMLAGLAERRRELAVLRALGAGPGAIFAMLLAEGLLVTAAGALAGVALLAAGSAVAAPWLLQEFGIVLGQRLPGADELRLLGAIIATGLFASLIPGWRAWRMSLADGLTPRT
ncbi:ABC transporter permease [Azospira restricta]|uniref:ABC transporter permease n=1 Tax=Azospira restricta TaxID=404405 RepID=A0A974PWR7_9RHOO|nr:ABC transporter permease [Azospira restricta]QRJ62360.1 ABC transporter permease [Azospira restricta]